MDRLLFVSYNHGYKNVADSVQNHRLIPALSKYYEVDVLQRQVGDSKEGVWSPNVYIVDRLVYKLFPFLFSIFSFDRLLWCLLAYRKIRNTISNYQVLIMVYEPYTTRFLHYWIKKNIHNLLVISSLYDPYVDNVFFGESKVGLYLRTCIEKKITVFSDALIVYNEKHYALVKGRYPDFNKVFLSVFCGRESLPDSYNNKKSNISIFTLIHIGNIYGVRKIDCLDVVVSSLKKKIPNLSSFLRIVVLGTYCVGYEKVVRSGNNDVIIQSSPVYGDELVEAIEDSSGLLLIDPMDERNTCFPSKLCEYYQYDKPIFGLSSKGTPSYNSLKESGHVVCDEEDIDYMVNTLEKVLLGRGAYNFEFDHSFGDQFYPERVAKGITRIIQSL